MFLIKKWFAYQEWNERQDVGFEIFFLNKMDESYLLNENRKIKYKKDKIDSHIKSMKRKKNIYFKYFYW